MLIRDLLAKGREGEDVSGIFLPPQSLHPSAFALHYHGDKEGRNANNNIH